MKNTRLAVLIIPIIIIISLFINLPKIPIKFEKGPVKINTEIGGYNLSLFGGKYYRDLNIRKGLDLAGGILVVLQADMSSISEGDRVEAIESAKKVIERRVNLFGVTEPTIQTSKIGQDYRIIIELPGVYDTQEAINLIGTTAKLKFKEIKLDDFTDTELSGSDLKKAGVAFDQQNGEPQVSLEFTAEGAKKFGEITKRNLQKPLAIFLDEVPVTAPVVRTVISDGRAVITGKFTVDEAKNLSIQLNAGALPVSVKIIEQRNIGATLGLESIRKSIYAGLVGLFLVAFFMIGNYGKLGLIANLALVIYTLITLAVYKMIPVVLTLPGISGFILSIGMAVDSNILIFERIKEERRLGKPLGLAMELGFGKAWDSIRDANISTLITCFILFNPFSWGFLVTSGPVRGFAVTLFLGVVISLFTGIVVTRNLIRAFYKG